MVCTSKSTSSEVVYRSSGWNQACRRIRRREENALVETPGERLTGQAVPVPSGDVLVCGCQQDDVAVLKAALGRKGPSIRTVDKPAEMARQVVLRLPLAVFLGLRKRDRARLQIIPLLRALFRELPLIVIADEASLELERRARQEGIFYYFVHPLGSAEVQAVLKDLLRRAAREPRQPREIAPRPVTGQQVGSKRSES